MDSEALKPHINKIKEGRAIILQKFDDYLLAAMPDEVEYIQDVRAKIEEWLNRPPGANFEDDPPPKELIHVLNLHPRFGMITTPWSEAASENVSTKEQADIPRPLSRATRLLSTLLDEKNCDAVLGDLEEGYEAVFRGRGKRGADRWFYKQVALTVWPLVWDRISRAVKYRLKGLIR